MDADLPEAVTPQVRPKPFPYASLPAISREELRIRSRMQEAASCFVDTGALTAALSDLLGEPLSIAVRAARILPSAAAPSNGVGVVFAPADEPGLARAALVDVEPALASGVVARALRQRAPKVTDGSRAASPELAGALAALLHAAVRRAHGAAPLRVVAAGPASALARDLAAVHGRVATASLTVVAGAESFDARVCVPLVDVPQPTARRPLSHDDLLTMGDVPLALPLVATTCLAGRATLGSLRAGDAFILPSFPLRESDGLLVGPVAIVPRGAERGIAADLGERGRLMLRSGPLESHPWDDGASTPVGDPMSGEPNPTLEVLEDAPVVVRVELGVVEMKACEWAALAPGDVVTLGRKLGDPVMLRAGGVELAHGELVQVDGEYGVRILGRPGGR